MGVENIMVSAWLVDQPGEGQRQAHELMGNDEFLIISPIADKRLEG